MAYLQAQIKNIVNDSVNEALGTKGLSQLDTTDFVSLGKALGNYNLYEGFFSALANRIVKTVYFVRTYEANDRRVLRDEHEYGAFIQKVYYELPEAVDNPTFEIPDSDTGLYTQASPYDVATTVPVSTLIFGGKGTWSIEIVRPIDQIKTAFLDEASMASFIDGIYVTVENAFKLEEERLVALAVNTAMAQALSGGIARNLLAQYNEEFSKSYTAEEAMATPDFLRFASMEINKVVKNMRKMSKVYNKAGYATFTDSDKMVIEMLSHFVSASEMYLQSDTFHNELVALPNFEDVPFWQASGNAFDFTDCSAINVKSGSLELNQSGIISFIHDIENVAAYFGDRKSWEMVNPRSDVVIHGEKAQKGFAVDNHANAVVFYLAAAGTASLAAITHGSATLSSTAAYRGQTITVTAAPSDGYHVKSAKVGDADLVKVSDTVYTWKCLSDSNVEIAVVMEANS
jgi:hypothetical protein